MRASQRNIETERDIDRDREREAKMEHESGGGREGQKQKERGRETLQLLCCSCIGTFSGCALTTPETVL